GRVFGRDGAEGDVERASVTEFTEAAEGRRLRPLAPRGRGEQFCERVVCARRFRLAQGFGRRADDGVTLICERLLEERRELRIACVAERADGLRAHLCALVLRRGDEALSNARALQAAQCARGVGAHAPELVCGRGRGDSIGDALLLVFARTRLPQAR